MTRFAIGPTVIAIILALCWHGFTGWVPTAWPTSAREAIGIWGNYFLLWYGILCLVTNASHALIPEPKTVKRTLHFHQLTHRDILCSRNGDAESSFWLRLSRIDFHIIGDKVHVTMPESLAKERGLL